MPTTGAPHNIWFPDDSEPVVLDTLFAELAQSVANAIDAALDSLKVSRTSFVPTFNNLSRGNGSASGAYSVHNGWCEGWATLTIGSTTSFSGSISLNTPVTAAVEGIGVGTGVARDVSGAGAAGRKQLILMLATTTLIQPFASDADVLSAANPWTWATGDTLAMTFRYPVPE